MPEALPLFPLNAVLFPGGVLPLKIFEQRYMSMAKACIRDGSPFGVCLIAEGREVGQPARPHALGTRATIETWDMPQLGVLHVRCLGGERFQVLESAPNEEGLLIGQVAPIAGEPSQPIPAALQGVVPLLRAIVREHPDAFAQPHAFDDAAWVGCRWCELLPIPLGARQMLLELDEPLARLEIVHKFLVGRGLVG